MKKKNRLIPLLSCLLVPLLLTGCQGKETAPREPRDNHAHVLVPQADGKQTEGNDLVSVDTSNKSEGYICIRYLGSAAKAKAILTGGDGMDYQYNLSPGDDMAVLPLTAGDGSYLLHIYEQLSGDQYASVYTTVLDVTLQNEFGPFLYPNQYVRFSAETQAVALAESLCADARTDLDVVSAVYHYVTENITYDTEKAETVTSGYLPDVDETLETGTGICFDYAALMTCMLRSQRIPTRLEIGYAGSVYHSWISTYLEEAGWVDNIIEFDGKSWKLMDPTFAANADDTSADTYIGDGEEYILKFSR